MTSERKPDRKASPQSRNTGEPSSRAKVPGDSSSHASLHNDALHNDALHNDAQDSSRVTTSTAKVNSEAVDSERGESRGGENLYNEDELWDQLGEVLEEFSGAWSAAPPEPELQGFVEKAASAAFHEFRVLALIELIKIDLEVRAAGNFTRKTVAEYVASWPELAPDGAHPPDLVYEEMRLRPSISDMPSDPMAETATRRQLPAGEVPGGPGHVGMDQLARMIDPDFSQSTSLLARSRAHQYEPGQQIDDFDLLARLGKGAFASVFLARQNSMQRLVALKISADQGVEGQTLAQLDHPHIVRVYDQRVIGEPRVRLMYMQYIAGGSLSQVISKIGKQPRNATVFVAGLNRVLDDTGEVAPVQSENRKWLESASWDQVVSRIGAQLASALEYSHGEGVLHRDIKPANVLIDLHGFPKLVDFNISFSSNVAGTTAASYFGGSLAYMSPEQLEASSHEFIRQPDSLTATSDIFSLGVLLFELLDSRRPFSRLAAKAETNTLATDTKKDGDVEPSAGPRDFLSEMIAIRRKGLNDNERSTINCGNALLSGAIERCLDAREENRFQNAASLQRQLTWAADDEISKYVCQSTHGWKRITADWPFVAISLAGLAIALFATWFVVSYLNEAAIEDYDKDLYVRVRQTINAIVFPGIMLLSYLLIRPVSQALWDSSGTGPDSSRSPRDPSRLLASTGSKSGPAEKTVREHDSTETEPASDTRVLESERFASVLRLNLNLGHYLAIVFAIAWSLAGVCYPVFLSMAGADVSAASWYDFIMSHCLAGLLTAAYLFCTITALSLVSWHPRLVVDSLRREIDPDIGALLSKVLNRNIFYQILAVATPLAAIAILVKFRDESNTFAVGMLSTAAFFGLGVLAWAARNIERSIKTLQRMKD